MLLISYDENWDLIIFSNEILPFTHSFIHSFILRVYLRNLRSTGMGTVIQIRRKHTEQEINRDLLINLRVHAYHACFCISREIWFKRWYEWKWCSLLQSVRELTSTFSGFFFSKRKKGSYYFKVFHCSSSLKPYWHFV